MLSHIPFLAVHFQKGIPTMKTIFTGVILAGLFAVAGCTQTAEKPPPTVPTNGGDRGSGHMPDGQQHGPGHKGGREER